MSFFNLKRHGQIVRCQRQRQMFTSNVNVNRGNNYYYVINLEINIKENFK